MSEKRKYNRKLITLNCDFCGNKFQKPLTEYKRCQRLGRHSYCSRECSAKGAVLTKKSNPHKPASDKMIEHLKCIWNNKRDEYTPFRYSLRCARTRFQEVNITLDDLKELWEKQKGICPYTGFRLILPENSNVSHIDFFQWHHSVHFPIFQTLHIHHQTQRLHHVHYCTYIFSFLNLENYN